MKREGREIGAQLIVGDNKYGAELLIYFDYLFLSVRCWFIHHCAFIARIPFWNDVILMLFRHRNAAGTMGNHLRRGGVLVLLGVGCCVHLNK